MLAIALKRPRQYYIYPLMACVYAGMIIRLVPAYFRWDANVILGLALAPYLCTINRHELSLRYIIPAFLSLALAIILPVNTLVFIALLFTALLFAESCFGKINNTFVLLILLISPVFGHFTHLVEFPVRLWLTQLVTHVLTLAGISATAVGNQVSLSKYEFAVDPACAGLNMLVTSLIICLFALSFYQRKLNKILHFAYAAAAFAIAILLNVVCNFFRILLLVHFKIMPGTFFHDAVGIGCLFLYVMLPLLFFTAPFVNRFGRMKQNEATSTLSKPGNKYLWLQAVFLAAVVFTSFRVVKADSAITNSAGIQLPGYKKTSLTGGIVKLENSEALIYIKPTTFYSPEHDPMVCWTGSGYVFKNIKTQQINGHNIYTALLQKGNDKIYAAWWFDNGKLKTINQLAWRWQAARGEGNFYLINVNAGSQQMLAQKLDQLFAQHFNF